MNPQFFQDLQQIVSEHYGHLPAMARVEAGKATAALYDALEADPQLTVKDAVHAATSVLTAPQTNTVHRRQPCPTWAQRTKLNPVYDGYGSRIDD